MTISIPIHKTVLLAVIILLASACSEANKSKHVNDEIKGTATMSIQNVPITNNSNDTLIIDNNCAVTVIPDSAQFEKMKIKFGKDMEVVTDDINFYNSQANDFFDTVKLNVIKCEGKKYLKFIAADKTSEIVDLTNLTKVIEVYFFTPSKKHTMVDIMRGIESVKEEYKKYFN